MSKSKDLSNMISTKRETMSGSRSFRNCIFLALFWSAWLLPQNLATAQQQQQPQPPSSLQEARELWNNLTRGLAMDYTFEYLERGSDIVSPESYVIDVRSDVVTNIYLPQFTPIFGTPPDPADFPTVPDLFAMIDDASETALVEPVVQYNAKYGYPLSLSILYNSTDFVEITISSLTPYTLLEEELEAQMDLWYSYDELTEDYSFVVETSCFCLSDYVTPKQLVVENNTIVSTTDVTTGESSEYDYQTIPELFQRIRKAIDEYYVQIGVSYNNEFGYPTNIFTEPEYGLADAFVSIDIRNVTWGASDEEEQQEEEEEEVSMTTSPTASPTAAPIAVPQPSPVPVTGSPVEESSPTGFRPERPLGRRFCFGLFRNCHND